MAAFRSRAMGQRRGLLVFIAPGQRRGFARFAGAARKSCRRIAPQRLGQCGVEIISRDAHVAQPMILAVDEVRELTAMFDGGDHLPDA